MSSKDEIQLRVSNAYIKYCELEDKSNKKILMKSWMQLT